MVRGFFRSAGGLRPQRVDLTWVVEIFQRQPAYQSAATGDRSRSVVAAAPRWVDSCPMAVGPHFSGYDFCVGVLSGYNPGQQPNVSWNAALK